MACPSGSITKSRFTRRSRRIWNGEKNTHYESRTLEQTPSKRRENLRWILTTSRRNPWFTSILDCRMEMAGRNAILLLKSANTALRSHIRQRWKDPWVRPLSQVQPKQLVPLSLRPWRRKVQKRIALQQSRVVPRGWLSQFLLSIFLFSAFVWTRLFCTPSKKNRIVQCLPPLKELTPISSQCAVFSWHLPPMTMSSHFFQKQNQTNRGSGVSSTDQLCQASTFWSSRTQTKLFLLRDIQNTTDRLKSALAIPTRSHFHGATPGTSVETMTRGCSALSW